MQKISEYAYFGGGCFWCIEAVFKTVKGVISTMPGYAGGKKENPAYVEVCSGKTGHAEVVRIEFDPAMVSYEGLLEIFFAAHDPTALNRQGNDIGTQYRSIILYVNKSQKESALDLIKKLESMKTFSAPIVTEVRPLGKFHEAEPYHRDYFAQNPRAPYCHSVIAPKLDKFKKLNS
jgi:peptide-methionine (S)-S-oxide reductase